MAALLNKVIYLLTGLTSCIFEPTIKMLPYRPGNEPFQIIGIFSNCNNNRTQTNHPNNSSQFRIHANACQHHMRYIAQRRHEIADYIVEYHLENTDLLGSWKYLFNKRRRWSEDDVQYIEFEICTPEDAARLAIDIVLDQKYFVNNKTHTPPYFDSLEIKNWWMITKVLAVVLFTGINVFRKNVFRARALWRPRNIVFNHGWG